MHYLIDGHNLIASMTDISLEDPHDEAKLVLRLRSWAATESKRRVTVIFDGGLPGGRERFLSGGPVQVIFASTGKTADALLITRMGQVKDRAAYTLVSSDREVLAAARNRGVASLTSAEFAGKLDQNKEKEAAGIAAPAELREEPALSAEELAEWLDLFGPAPPATPSAPKKPSEKRTPETTDDKTLKAKKEPPSESPAELKSGNRRLRNDEIDDWLEIFGKSGRD